MKTRLSVDADGGSSELVILTGTMRDSGALKQAVAGVRWWCIRMVFSHRFKVIHEGRHEESQVTPRFGV